MPAKSQAQLALMYAVAAGKSDAVPKAVAREFIRKTKRRKGLPKRVGK